ncbi:MAG: hypothetical protein ACXWXJ_03295 [Aeromicrobium sp.]
MIRHARRALPWSILTIGVAVFSALLAVVERWPYTMWPLQGAAVGLLAGTAAWCFEEPSAAVVDTMPRSLRWRTIARSAGIVGLLLVWCAAVALTSAGYFGHARDIAWQGLTAALATTSYVTWRRSQGVATPARGISAAVISLALFLALARPLAEWAPIFPYTADGDWQSSRVIWTVLAAVSLAALAVTMSGNSSLTSSSPRSADWP